MGHKDKKSKRRKKQRPEQGERRQSPLADANGRNPIVQNSNGSNEELGTTATAGNIDAANNVQLPTPLPSSLSGSPSEPLRPIIELSAIELSNPITANDAPIYADPQSELPVQTSAADSPAENFESQSLDIRASAAADSDSSRKGSTSANLAVDTPQPDTSVVPHPILTEDEEELALPPTAVASPKGDIPIWQATTDVQQTKNGTSASKNEIAPGEILSESHIPHKRKVGFNSLTLRSPSVETREAIRDLRGLVFKRVLQTATILSVGIFIIVACLVDYELETSWFQSKYFNKIARSSTFAVGDGPSSLIRFPSNGPYDLRLGYALLPSVADELQKAGFVVKSQAVLSDTHASLIDHGVFPMYDAKLQTGLQIVDRNKEPVLLTRYPEAFYKKFEDIPPFIYNTLLYIEDRHALDDDQPFRNPAVDWNRFTKAVLDVVRSKFDKGHDVHGGSTLATQLEKFKHSDEGITGSPKEKLRQMFSAAIRSYRDGRGNLDARKLIVRDYINSVPLAALAGYGEINGLGDGMWAYFSADLAEVNTVLKQPVDPSNPTLLTKQAIAYRQILSLFLAHRRPSDYLLNDPAALSEQVQRYLPLLLHEGVIPQALYEEALVVPTTVRRVLPKAPRLSFLTRKGPTLIRTHLLQLLGMDRLYDVDRLDLSVYTTLDEQSQTDVTKVLNQLRDPEYVASLNLGGERLLATHGDLSHVIYSFTLYEREGSVNKLRVQTDNFDQPLNINEGVKLDLGSTAKLRTLITYLEIIETLYHELKGASKEVMAHWPEKNPDNLSRWAHEYLTANKNPTLDEMLRAAMERHYSASPGESFFTAGGIHTFSNFNKDDNGKVPTVRESLQKSINLPFIRIMRDVVSYCMLHTTGSTARTLDTMEDMTRQEYLSRFADREGKVFLSRFYKKYQGKTPKEILQMLLDGVERQPRRVAAVFWVLHPEADLKSFAAFMRESFDDREFSEEELQKYYAIYANREFTLGDKGYLARVHPLELWVASYLIQHTGAKLSEAVSASVEQRQSVYGWLFAKKRKRAQDSRIRMMLEAEAFSEIHRRWQRLGYSLSSLVPSLATALGTSADRPDSLAQLMGIIVNGGKKLPYIKVDRLDFATRTPYETTFVNATDESEQVLSPELVAVVREAIIEVVEKGTAVRMKGGFTVGDQVFPVGGKTGTGDHRHDVYGAGGRLIESTVVNRTATFVFLIGNRYFGTITAIVRGKEAENFKFTSALPVQLLKLLKPAIEPLLARGELAQQNKSPENP